MNSSYDPHNINCHINVSGPIRWLDSQLYLDGEFDLDWQKD
jgi:hypothetical protein